MELTKEQQLFRTIIHKSWEDETFKQKLITNPIPTIENLGNVSLKVPEGKTIIVCDQTDESVVYINIPVKQTIDDMELTEEQLEIIAGGGDPSAVLQNSANPNPLGGTVGG